VHIVQERLWYVLVLMWLALGGLSEEALVRLCSTRFPEIVIVHVEGAGLTSPMLLPFDEDISIRKRGIIADSEDGGDGIGWGRHCQRR